MNKAKPTVALLHYACPPLIGGVEAIIDAHARLLVELGYDTRLIVGEGGTVHPKVNTVVVPEISAHGGPESVVIEMLKEGEVHSDFNGAVRRADKSLSNALQGVDVCIIHNVLTMHFNLVATAALAKIMKRRKNIHFIGWIHDSTFGDPNYKEHQRNDFPWSLLSQELPGCDYCVISAQRRLEMKKLFGVPASHLPVIRDGIDMQQLLGLTSNVTDIFHSEELHAKDFVALTPTRIVRRKNLEAGMGIVAALKKLGKSVRWMITGAPDGYNADSMKYYNELLAMRRKLRIEKEVIFLCERFDGTVSNDDMRGLYGVSDILLFPSEREGFGIPVLEAGISGLLVVISDIPALRELGGRDTVYIYPGEDPGAVACRILRGFNRSPRLLFRKKIITNYSWDAIFADTILPAVVKPKSLWKAKK